MENIRRNTIAKQSESSATAQGTRTSNRSSILVIDNYDSFTYNLVHAIKKLSGQQVDVYRNDEIGLDEIGRYEKIVLSPGPGLPEEAGLLLDIIKTYATSKNILGVCLGHQAIGVAFGGALQNMNRVMHGLASAVTLTPAAGVLFEGLPGTFNVGRYHSWTVQKEDLPGCFEITSYDEEGRIMSMKHKDLKVEGVQFHPESVLTPLGEKIIDNWLKEA